MDSASVWKQCFRGWPAELPRRGVLVAAFDEQIPFDGFTCSETMLLIERRTPDTLGARMLLMPYEQVVAVKITDVVKVKAFHALGFDDVRPAHPKAGH